MTDEEVPKSRTTKRDIVDVLASIDHKKATKFIIKGMIIAIIFGSIALTSKSVALNATDWYNWQVQENENNYMNGVYGYDEYLKQLNYLISAQNFMAFQEAIFTNIARIGVDIGLILVLVGFIAYASNKDLNDKMRLLSLILAGTVIAVIMFTSLFTNVSITMS